jgi:hypothetical protein
MKILPCLRVTTFVGVVVVGVAQAQTPLREFSGPLPGDMLGVRVTSGDVDGDGLPELLLGAYQANGSQQGYVQVRSGADGHLMLTLEGDAPGDRLGRGLSLAGDIDEDGYGDILAGAYQPFLFGPGWARLYSGRDGSILYEFVGDQIGDDFGGSTASAGDVNGDGIADLVVGAPQRISGQNGYVRVFSGADGSLIHHLVGRWPCDLFGSFLTSIGDIDGDTVPDLLVGAPQLDLLPRRGYALIFSGATGAKLRLHSGDRFGEFLGTSVAAVGDLNDDQVPDYAIGVPGARVNNITSGAVRVYSGIDGSLLSEAVGHSDQSFFGIDVDGGADLNGDGSPELLIGAIGESPSNPWAGSCFVVCAFSGETLLRIDAAAPDTYLGIGVHLAGDLDGDGVEEVLIGAYRDDPNGPESGSAFLYSGASLFEPHVPESTPPRRQAPEH